MRINQTKRIYMNEEGGSPGGGAAPPASAPPAAPPGPPPDVLDQMKSAMNEVIGGFRTELTSWKNGIFADLRKSGALGKDKPAETPIAPTPTAATPPSSPAPASLTMDQVEAMLEQTRVIERASVENGLTDAQVKRMRNALKAEGPDDVAAWTKTYLADMGLAKAPAQTPNQTPASPSVTPSTQPPNSDKGSPAPGGAVAWESEFMRDPLRMSPAAKAAMAAKHGAEKARVMRLEAIKQRAEQIRVVVNS